MNKSQQITTNSRVAVIGGGPAGSSFALYLLRYAREQGVKPEVTIYQRRDFDELGPRGCKGCAGILSMAVLRNLQELGLTIPADVVRSRIEQYTVHSPYTSISLSNPENELQIASVYRGGGPRISHDAASASFDGWLLAKAKEHGVRVVNQTVAGIKLGDEVKIEADNKELPYDLVVLATGVNAKPVSIQGLNYIPPRTQIMTLGELYLGNERVESLMGNAVHAFLIPNSGIIFGALVPKGAYVDVAILHSGAHPVSVASFLSNDIVRTVIQGNYEVACSCRPRALVGSARNYYADRFVATGDAAVTRLYKDGIGSSLLIARQAARCVIHHGVSRRDFDRYYAPLYNIVSRDNQWGHFLFSINDRAKDSPIFLRAQHRLIGDEQHNTRGRQYFTKAAWGMFTGNYSYTSIASMTLNPLSLAKLIIALMKETVAGLFHKRDISGRKLHVGSKKVLILGSGFGGTYVLRHLVPALNRNENVETTMVSDENYFLFSPLLHEVAAGRIETRHIAYPIRRLHWRDRFNFIQASVEKIDLARRRVITTSGVLEFDYLVLALGSLARLSELPAAAKNVFTLKTLHDSVLIRNHIIEVFEKASVEIDQSRQKELLTFVVAGAGHIGVQLVTELRDFIHGTLLKLYRAIAPEMVRIMLVEDGPKIMADMQFQLGAYAMKQLKQIGVEVRLKSRVTSVRDDCLELNGAESVPTHTLLWVAGVVANQRIAEMDVEKDSLGRVSVTEYLEVPGFPGVYGVGDCIHFEDPKTGQPIAPRAHLAVRQARVVARNILAEIRGKNKKPYQYTNTAEVVSLGSCRAIFRFYSFRLYGFPARLMWLVGYASLITGTYNRIRVILDWLLSVLFSRDTTFLKLK